jgi:DNA-binding protein YbaB
MEAMQLSKTLKLKEKELAEEEHKLNTRKEMVKALVDGKDKEIREQTNLQLEL